MGQDASLRGIVRRVSPDISSIGAPKRVYIYIRHTAVGVLLGGVLLARRPPRTILLARKIVYADQIDQIS